MPVNDINKGFYLGPETATFAEILAAPTLNEADLHSAVPNILAGLPPEVAREDHWGLDLSGTGIEILCKGHVNLDYRRTASVYVVLVDSQAVAINIAAGRAETDHRTTFVLNEEGVKDMISRIEAVAMRERIKTATLEVHNINASIHLPRCGYSTVKLGESKRDADWG